MEISKVMKGSKQQLFGILMDSLLADIYASTQQQAAIEDIHVGYFYKKQLSTKLGKAGVIKVTITKLEVPNLYEATFQSAQGFNTLSYALEDVDDTHVKVVYQETFMSEKKSQNLNYGLMSWLYKRSNKKKANLVLNQIETMMNT